VHVILISIPMGFDRAYMHKDVQCEEELVYTHKTEWPIDVPRDNQTKYHSSR
jgi:hypothetical protein